MVGFSASFGSACAASCLALQSLLGLKVSFAGSQVYTESVSSYWSEQASGVQPHCIISPTNVKDVSVAVKLLTNPSVYSDAPLNGTVGTGHALKRRCKFAVRSGGHATLSSASTEEDGVTIDLRGLNSLEVSKDRTSVSVGVGLSWVDVYSFLDPLSLCVAGGRSGDVGVGGLTLGGGISYFSPRYGWTCDTVLNFEVVLATGEVVNVNENQNSDLFIALRGGWNNFGIVTRLTLQTFEQGPFWGGVTHHPLTAVDESLSALIDMNSAINYDKYSSLMTSFGFSSASGLNIASNLMEYTRPVGNPPVFQRLMRLPTFANSMRITNMTDLANETAAFEVIGKRYVVSEGGMALQQLSSKRMYSQLFATLTVESNYEVLNQAFIYLNDSIPAVADIPGIVWTMVLEPLPPAIYKKGRNSLGLENRTKPLVVVLFCATWDRARDDSHINHHLQNLVGNVATKARHLAALDPFIYVNYAAWFQNPLIGYGNRSIDRLRDVKKRFDPSGVFTYQVPGGFKIPPS